MNKRYLKIIIVSVLALLATVFTYFDSTFYSEPVIKVESTRVLSKQKDTDEYKNTDTQVTQRVTGRFLNTTKRGEKISLNNTYYQSQLTDQQFRKGQQVLLTKASGHYSLNDVKRDTVMVLSIGLVIVLLFCMEFSRKNLFTSVLLNLVIYYGFIKLLINTRNSALLLLTIVMALLISAIALVVILGPTMDAVMAYSSTVIATSVSILLSVFLMKLSGYSGIHLELTDFGLQPYFSVFISQVILSVLGVILDETMDITSSLIEMKKEISDISEKKLFKSGINIGRELIGPLINILLFIVIAEHLNVVLLYLSNGNSIGYTFEMTLSLGFSQLLISAIGIVLTVPITSFIASKMIARRAI